MNEASNVVPTVLPDREAMRQHLEHLFGGDLDGYHDGLIEISWDAKWKGAGFQSALFPATDIDAAIDEAVKQNLIPKQNVYVGATLKNPDTPPFGRTGDEDFYASTVVWADLDEEGSVEAAKERWAAAKPTKIIVTGRSPHRRLQLWWRLEEPITDAAYLRSMVEGMRDTFDGDGMVVNVGTLMRLGGTIAWPLKPGRTLERTEVHRPSGAPAFYVDALLNDAYPPADSGLVSTAQGGINIVRSAPAPGSLGLTHGLVTDGREQHMRDTALACFVEFCGENGAEPTPQELFDMAWPQYERTTSFSRPGRREGEMAQKCKSLLQRFAKGRIRGLPDIDAVVASYRARRAQEATQPKKPPTPAPVPHNDNHDGIVWLRDVEPKLDADDFIEGVLTRNSLAVVYGPSNVGKTFFTTDMTLHASWGRAWHGREVERGAVLYVCLEGEFGIHNRIAAFKKQHQCGDIPFVVYTTSLDLRSSIEGADRVIGVAKQVEKDSGLPVVAIVIDTMARATGGAEENSSEGMGPVLAHADHIRRETGACVIFVAHPGKDTSRGIRGWYGITGAVDTIILVDKNEATGAVTATVEKQRDLPKDSKFHFRIAPVQIGTNRRGKPVTSCVVEHLSEMHEQDEGPTLSAREQQAMRVVFDFFAAPNCPPAMTFKAFNEALISRGVIERDARRAAFTEARQGLVRKRKIRVENELIYLVGMPQRGAKHSIFSPKIEPNSRTPNEDNDL